MKIKESEIGMMSVLKSVMTSWTLDPEARVFLFDTDLYTLKPVCWQTLWSCFDCVVTD